MHRHPAVLHLRQAAVGVELHCLYSVFTWGYPIVAVVHSVNGAAATVSGFSCTPSWIFAVYEGRKEGSDEKGERGVLS